MNQRGLLQSILAATCEPKPQVLPQETEEFGLDIFTGAMPDSLEQPATGTHLVHIPLNLKLYDGGGYLETSASAIAQASGTPGYYRLTRFGVAVHQGTCGADNWKEWKELCLPTEIVAKGVVTIHAYSLRRI